MNRHEKQEVETSLRNLLEEMSINDKNLEYYSCIELINKITRIFKQLKQNNQEYKKLECVLQQQEAEIRNHISLEQQMKLYQDGLQQKLDEANQEIKKLQNEICQSQRKEQSHDGSMSYRQVSPKKQLSLSQHGGYTSHRNSCDELFKRYNKLLQQQQASISQRSTNIQISQFMMKGRQTLSDICNIQPSRSQNKSANKTNQDAIKSLLKMK